MVVVLPLRIIRDGRIAFVKKHREIVESEGDGSP
jgi:hypothetical protein